MPSRARLPEPPGVGGELAAGHIGQAPAQAAPGISGEVARFIIAGRRGDAYEHWMRGIGVPRPR